MSITIDGHRIDVLFSEAQIKRRVMNDQLRIGDKFAERHRNIAK